MTSTLRLASGWDPDTHRATRYTEMVLADGRPGTHDDEQWTLLARRVLGRGTDPWQALAAAGYYCDPQVEWTCEEPSWTGLQRDWDESHPRDTWEYRVVRARRAGGYDAPVGLAEIADRLGVGRSTVDQWRTRDLLPEPRWTVGGRPAWAWPDVEAWARETGRL